MESEEKGEDVLGTEGEGKNRNARGYFVSFCFLYFKNFNYGRLADL